MATHGKVTGVGPTRETTERMNGFLFTEATATSDTGTDATAQVKSSGEGWFELKVAGKTVLQLFWDESGKVEQTIGAPIERVA